MDKLTQNDILNFFALLADVMPQHQEQLRELDAAMGDGDLGVTITLGMKGVKEGLPALAEKNIGTILARSGLNFNRAAASTFGVLFASALMRAGATLLDKSEINLADLAQMFAAAAEGIRQRGNAELGDKTMLDVMAPMAQALHEAVDQRLSLEAAVELARERCHQALAATKAMSGKHGRAGWFREKSIGLTDPGSAALCLMLDCFTDFVQQRKW